MTVDIKRWPTRPLDCWGKAKELRLNHYQEFLTARDEGKLVVSGSATSFSVLISGLGDYAFLASEPYSAAVATEPQFAQACAETVEAKHYSRDLCAYMRNYWGSMYLDRYFFGGRFPKFDFCLQAHYCDSHAKWFQVVTEHLDLPYFAIDLLNGPVDRLEDRRDYIAGQLLDAIDWMEKVTGRKWDPDRARPAIINEFTNMALWAEICTLNKNVPAPLDEKSMYTLYVLNTLIRERPETVDFYRELRDEVRDRVADGVAAVSGERCRILSDSQPPWYFLKVFRYMEQYGAVGVGSGYTFGLSGSWEQQEDGSLGPAKTPMEKGMPLETREDLVRALADWWSVHFSSAPDSMSILDFHLPSERNRALIKMVEEWRCQGVVMHLNRGCEGSTYGQMENRLALLEAGIPVMTYEGNMADKREFDEAQTLDRLESFMESLGLSRLAD